MTIRGATAIVYPETDGMPLPDGEYQAPLYIRVVGTLRVHFRDVPGARVNGDTFIYYVEGNPRRSVAPDCYVALGLSEESLESIERNNVYLVWEVGKAPDFVLEIGSRSTASRDLGSKRDLYAELGVSEYWRYDESGGDFYGEPLVGERLVDGEYRRLELRRESSDEVWAHSDVLDLDLWWTGGKLQFWDPMAGNWLLSHEEAQARADEEYVRAEEAHIRAEEAHIRAEEAHVRAEEAHVRAEEAQAGAEEAHVRAEQERSGRLAADARVVELETELRRLRGE